jgi:hypothetical protein
LLASAGLLALVGCNLADASTGELNHGRFAYLCVDSSDPTCNGLSGGDAVIPDLIAVGGSFDLEYAGEKRGAAPVHVQSASDVMISSSSGNFEFRIPGIAAMLAKGNDGVVADFVHLRGVSIDHLDVAGPDSAGAIKSIEITTDDPVSLFVTPRDSLGAGLAGALPYAWGSSSAAIVGVGVNGMKSAVTLTGHAVGTATVEVSLPSGVKMAVLVTVKQGKPSSTSSSSGAGGTGGGSATTTTGAGGAGGGK